AFPEEPLPPPRSHVARVLGPWLKESAEKLLRSALSNSVSFCLKAPGLHNGTATNLSSMCLLHRSAQVILPAASILDQPQPWSECPSQFQKQTDSHADIPSKQCDVNISQQSRDPCDRENCLPLQYPGDRVY